MHYYQHHIGDFIKDTANLNDHQLATYLRMIWAYYTDEKCFTDDCGGIAFAVRSDEETVRRILAHYFVQTPDGWAHPRCEREIGLYREKAEKARNSANARWKNANAMRAHSERNANEPVFDANQEPRTKSKKGSNDPVVGQVELLGEQSNVTAIRPPYDEILGWFRERLPSLPQPRNLDDDRKKAIRTIMGKSQKHQEPDFFDRYFEYVSRSDFLMGRDRAGWKGCNFDWLMKYSNFRKVVEGNYDNDRENNHA